MHLKTVQVTVEIIGAKSTSDPSNTRTATVVAGSGGWTADSDYLRKRVDKLTHAVTADAFRAVFGTEQ
jgi:hypothetical protein